MKRRINMKWKWGKPVTRRFLLLVGVVAACSCACAEIREWTSLDGDFFDGEFVLIVGDKVVLRDAEGKQHRFPLEKLSKEDRAFIELENPPTFDIDVAKDSERFIFPQKYKAYSDVDLPTAFDYTFTAKINQTSLRSYSHELHVEMIVIGAEIDGNNYILFDRQESVFVPSKQKDLSYEFSGRTVRLYDFNFYNDGRRGQKTAGWIVIITDVRGEVIAYKSPQKWLYDVIDPVRKLSLGAHFDKTGKRVFPPRPKMGR